MVILTKFLELIFFSENVLCILGVSDIFSIPDKTEMTIPRALHAAQKLIIRKWKKVPMVKEWKRYAFTVLLLEKVYYIKSNKPGWFMKMWKHWVNALNYIQIDFSK